MKNKFYKNFVIHQFDTLDSTNSKALELISSNQISDREIITANHQTKGRGRLDRVWQSFSGNLCFSMVLKVDLAIDKTSQLSFIAATAMNSALKDAFLQENLLNQEIKIQNKWPNDILINDKKVAGILSETVSSIKHCQFAVVGIGLNFTQNPQNTPFLACNLSDFGLKMQKDEFLELFLDKFEVFFQKWQDFGFFTIKNAYLENIWRLKSEISVNIGEEKIIGIFEGIDDEGCLILSQNSELRKISFGDVSM